MEATEETALKRQIARDRYAVQSLTAKRSALNKQISFLKSRQSENEEKLDTSYKPESIKATQTDDERQLSLEFEWMYE